MSAAARKTAAPSATASRILRLRAGSISQDSGRRSLSASPARMPFAGPGREHQDQAGVLCRAHLATLVRLEVKEQAGAAGDRPLALLDLDLTVGHDEPSALVHLVLLERLAARQVDRDDAGFVVRAKYLWLVRQDRQRGDVPGVHVRTMPQSPARVLARRAVRSNRSRGGR